MQIRTRTGGPCLGAFLGCVGVDSGRMRARVELDEIVLASPPAAWEALGFTVVRDVVALGGVRLRLGARPGEAGARAAGAGEEAREVAATGGIVGWSLRGLADGADLDGLPTAVSDAPPPEPVTHENGAV